MDLLTPLTSSPTRLDDVPRRATVFLPGPPAERRAVHALHAALHRELAGVVRCSYERPSGPVLPLCAGPVDATPSGRADGTVAVQVVPGGADRPDRYQAVLPVRTSYGVVGHLRALSTNAPDLATLTAIAEQHASGHATEPPLPLTLSDQEALADLFTPVHGRRPTIAALLEQVATACGGPVVMQTHRLVVLGAAGPAGADDAVRTVALSHDDRAERELAETAQRAPGPSVGPGSCPGVERVVLAVPTDAGRSPLLVAEVRAGATWSLAVLRQAVNLLSWLLRMLGDDHADASLRRSAVLSDLRRGGDHEGVVTRAAVLGHDLHRPSHALVLLPVDGDGSPVTLHRLAATLADSLRTADASGPEALVAVDDGLLVALVEDDGGPVELAARRHLAAVQRGGRTLVCGIGPGASGPEGLARSIEGARRAAEVLRHHNRAGAVVAHDDLGVYGFLFAESDRGRLEAFVQRWLGPLIAADTAHADLLQTVDAVLDNPTMSSAASALYVHVSTLKYRCRRIEEILGADLRDPETAFNLRLARRLASVAERLDAPVG